LSGFVNKNALVGNGGTRERVAGYQLAKAVEMT